MPKRNSSQKILFFFLISSLVVVVLPGNRAALAATQVLSAWIWPLDRHLDRATVLQGEGLNSRFGIEVARGDFNGDQIPDLLVGAPVYEAGEYASGKAYLFSGPFEWGHEISASQADLTITSAGAIILLGQTLAGGDLNGDGYDEIILSGVNDTNDTDLKKQAYIYPGSLQIGSGSAISYTLATNPPMWVISGNWMGVVTTCDLNGDQYQDLFTTILVTDTLYMNVVGILGSATGLDTPRSIYLPAQADVLIDGITLTEWTDPPNNNLGCGDIDGNGIDDLVIGAWGQDVGDKRSAGSVYIIQGRESLTTTQPAHLMLPVDANLILQGSDGCCPEGYLSGDKLGSGIIVADFNADGKDDIVAGAEDGDGINNWYGDAGEAYLWFGRPLDSSTDLIANQAIGMLYAENSYSFLGIEMDSGDFNADGEEDLLIACIGCKGEPFSNDESGMVMVVESAATLRGWRAIRQVADWLGVQGLSSDGLGFSVVAADLDGDGADDMAMSAPYGSYYTDSPGYVYLLPYPARYRALLPIIER